jgi:hypothetical protein
MAETIDITPELRAYMAEREARNRERFLKEQPDDFLDRWLPKARPFIDATPRPETSAPPSTIMAMRYCICMSGGRSVAEVRKAHEEAHAMAEAWRIESRRRYRNGFHASPLGEPV